MHHPHHVKFTPVVSVFAHFFLTLFLILWWLFLPGFILLLFPLVVSILLVFCSCPCCCPFSPSFAMALSLGSNLSWPLSVLRAAVIATIFSPSGDFAPQSPLVFNQSNFMRESSLLDLPYGICFSNVPRKPNIWLGKHNGKLCPLACLV